MNDIWTQRRGARAQGFTLIELMIVVAIIAILAALGLPMLREARISGNEANALSSLRTVSSSEEIYRNRVGVYGTLAQMVASGYIDESFSLNPRQGYIHNPGGPIDIVGWSFELTPEAPGLTGHRYFFCDQSGVIRFSTAGAATAASPPIE